TPRARRPRGGPSRSASAARRRRSRRRAGSPTTAPSGGAVRAPSPSRVRGLGPALLDDPEHAVRGLLDRELRDVDHRAAELAVELRRLLELLVDLDQDRKSTRLNSSHDQISYAVFCLKKKKNK